MKDSMPHKDVELDGRCFRVWEHGDWPKLVARVITEGEFAGSHEYLRRGSRLYRRVLDKLAAR